MEKLNFLKQFIANHKKLILNSLFIFYLIIVIFLKLVYIKRFGSSPFGNINTQYNLGHKGPYNWIPFGELRTLQLHWKHFLQNALLLVPSGYFLQRLFPKNHMRWPLLFSFCMNLELVQPALNIGYFDITTVMLMLLGASVGVIIATIQTILHAPAQTFDDFASSNT